MISTLLIVLTVSFAVLLLVAVSVPPPGGQA